MIADEDWFQPHFHQIDETGHLRITPPVFSQLLEVIEEHREQLWQAGMSAIHQYEEERDQAALFVHASNEDELTVALACATEANLYTQGLTVEVDLPRGVRAAAVTDAAGATVPGRVEVIDGRPRVRFDAPPVDAEYIVRAAGIGAAYARERGPEFPALGPHPYLLFSSTDVPALLGKTQDPMAKQLWQRIVEAADRTVSEAPNLDLQRGRQRWARPYRLRPLALAYVLTRDPKYLQRAIPEIEWLVQDEAWHVDRSEELDMAHAVGLLGLLYDWMYDGLPEELRARMREAIVEHGIKPTFREAAAREWWTAWYRCNWGSTIYGQVGLAAASILPERPEAAEAVRFCERKLWHYAHSLTAEGGWGEVR